MNISYEVNWEPLENFSNKHPQKIQCDDFMYMGSIDSGIPDNLINLYKHINTRKYINICDRGGLWVYYENEYLPTGNIDAEIERVNK